MTTMDTMCEKLRQYDTPTICNVIELFNVRPYTVGFMDGSVQAAYPELEPMVGFAATATCRTAMQPRSGDAYHNLTEQVERFGELSGAPVVVFQDLDKPVVAATFGEIMCTTYQAFGAVGLITNGGGRDLAQVHELSFPVFTGSTICSHGHIHIPDIHMPVHVGGMAIYPNDLLHGDLNGVTTIPLDIADEVADVADEFVAAEQIILTVLHQDNVSAAQLREAVTEADAKIDALRRRMRRDSA